MVFDSLNPTKVSNWTVNPIFSKFIFGRWLFFDLKNLKGFNLKVFSYNLMWSFRTQTMVCVNELFSAILLSKRHMAQTILFFFFFLLKLKVRSIKKFILLPAFLTQLFTQNWRNFILNHISVWIIIFLLTKNA